MQQAIVTGRSDLASGKASSALLSWFHKLPRAIKPTMLLSTGPIQLRRPVNTADERQDFLGVISVGQCNVEELVL